MFSKILTAAATAAALLMAGAASAATVVDGGFTGAALSGGFQTVGVGSSVIPGWTVVSGDVDWIAGYWQSADGDGYSIDLNGDRPGAIAQTISTIAGQAYRVTFDLSANPDAGNDIRHLLVNAGGAATTFVYDLNTAVNNHSDMNWLVESYDFVATGSSTTLTFASGDIGNCCYGPAIDKISIANAVPEPASWALMIVGFFGMGSILRHRRHIRRTAEA